MMVMMLMIDSQNIDSGDDGNEDDNSMDIVNKSVDCVDVRMNLTHRIHQVNSFLVS